MIVKFFIQLRISSLFFIVLKKVIKQKYPLVA